MTRTTRHHLIPVTLHKNKWFRKNFSREEMQHTEPLCRDCHRTVHKFIPHKQLGREYNTIERLLEHPKLGNFVKWIAKR
ncbi:hypothetical protein AB9P05_06010 [Roseivirga sp. BDSF3-8]|uniref:hypothetical protein n=1 Tax=Roseivirga sp. BDSF3-8 TaxID=3241598 RepID=UPI0035325497